MGGLSSGRFGLVLFAVLVGGASEAQVPLAIGEAPRRERAVLDSLRGEELSGKQGHAGVCALEGAARVYKLAVAELE